MEFWKGCVVTITKMKKFPPLGFDGKELDQIFGFVELIETENFVKHEFLCPSLLEDN